MKLALILVAVVLVVNVEGWRLTRRTSRFTIPRFPIPRFPTPCYPISRFPKPRKPSIPRMPWGKRNVREAEGDAGFKAAAEDGVLSNDEIKSVFGVKDEDLADFYDLYDVNGDGKITVEEYQSVTTILANAGDKEN
ncbi:hypothetical protein LOTGIDRAFT_230731 [Lottia gigantea]|uniref:EF-hand domain-containing protein n=1 Tax=Lottia gigantea TaxID=225164 RepID=V4B2D5_LOTGI|nr:hypothetical protein LOTGIDRAFT_230731 [Lottia gigantea]ESP00477.1 hypothetical protein LOTGIDRAFT_230731 [Lottia gigantea]